MLNQNREQTLRKGCDVAWNPLFWREQPINRFEFQPQPLGLCDTESRFKTPTRLQEKRPYRRHVFIYGIGSLSKRSQTRLMRLNGSHTVPVTPSELTHLGRQLCDLTGKRNTCFGNLLSSGQKPIPYLINLAYRALYAGLRIALALKRGGGQRPAGTGCTKGDPHNCPK
jgi:hypothetical protein